MSCEHLICARCAGPVVKGRCPACRETRSQVHHHSQQGVSTTVLLALFLVMLVVLALQLSH